LTDEIQLTGGKSMKKTFLLIVCLTLPLLARGQGALWGRVRFVNTASTLITTNASLGSSVTGPIAGPAGDYYFALFSAPAGTTDTSLFTFTGAYATNIGFAGRISGGDAEVPGAVGGNVFALLVRGWSANIGHDYSDAISYLANPTFEAWYGESPIGTIQPNPPEGPYPNLFGLFPREIPGFHLDLHGVPEPSSFAIAGLGTAALWLFRRRLP